MAALETVRAAYRAGVLLIPDGEGLVLSGGGALSPELRDAIVANQPVIITVLMAYGVGTDDGYGAFAGE